MPFCGRKESIGIFYIDILAFGQKGEERQENCYRKGNAKRECNIPKNIKTEEIML